MVCVILQLAVFVYVLFMCLLCLLYSSVQCYTSYIDFDIIKFCELSPLFISWELVVII